MKRDTLIVSDSEDFGKTTKGIPVRKFTIRPKLPDKLANGPDAAAWGAVKVVLLNYGAVLHQLWIPGHTDTGGKKKTSLTTADLALGFPDLASYEKNTPYHGAVLGRVAGRLSYGRFAIPYELDPSISNVYKVPKNLKKQHSLNGGLVGLSHRSWEVIEAKSDSVKMKVVSNDGDDGFPGTLTVLLTYRIRITEEDQVDLSLDYFASITDAVCPINLTNNTFFNLAGHRSGPEAIDRHFVTVNAEKMCELEADMLPSGRLLKVGKVDGTDLRKATCIKESLRKIHSAPFQGFDDYYVFSDLPDDEAKVIVSEPNSGRRVELFTDQLGVCLSSGNYLDPKTEPIGKDGFSYPQHSGLSLAAQGFPDAVNKTNFPKQFVAPNGHTYSQRTLYRFSF